MVRFDSISYTENENQLPNFELLPDYFCCKTFHAFTEIMINTSFKALICFEKYLNRGKLANKDAKVH